MRSVLQRLLGDRAQRAIAGAYLRGLCLGAVPQGRSSAQNVEHLFLSDAGLL
jgi:hypothetical protein